jgi:acyl-coenzyme A thioesterase PaaI-like protein
VTPAPAAELAKSVRALIDVTIRTQVDAATITSAKAVIDAVTAQLAASMIPGSFGIQSDTGASMAAGNVLIGERNAIAPPLTVAHDDNGRVRCEFELGAAYEGPSGHVHGGVCALVLDHVLGAAVHQPGRPAVTGTLTVRYRRGTPLNRPLRAEARVARVDGGKTFVSGQITADGETTVEADGIFFFPR